MHLLVGAAQTDVGLLADRGREGTLDGDLQVADGLDGFGRKHLAVVAESFQTAVDGTPDDAPLAAVGLGDRGFHDRLGDRENVDADPVPPEFAHDGMVPDLEAAVVDGDEIALGNANFFELRHDFLVLGMSEW